MVNVLVLCTSDWEQLSELRNAIAWVLVSSRKIGWDTNLGSNCHLLMYARRIFYPQTPILGILRPSGVADAWRRTNERHA
jgi:hypothetical protein